MFKPGPLEAQLVAPVVVPVQAPPLHTPVAQGHGEPHCPFASHVSMPVPATEHRWVPVVQAVPLSLLGPESTPPPELEPLPLLDPESTPPPEPDPLSLLGPESTPPPEPEPPLLLGPESTPPPEPELLPLLELESTPPPEPEPLPLLELESRPASITIVPSVPVDASLAGGSPWLLDDPHPPVLANIHPSAPAPSNIARRIGITFPEECGVNAARAHDSHEGGRRARASTK